MSEQNKDNKMLNKCITLYELTMKEEKSMQKKIEQKQKDKKYPELWAKVDSFAKENLPKSALEIVDKIYLRAKEEKLDDQLIKAYISS